jgi:molecular chaperone GrpE (heat shock protein)
MEMVREMLPVADDFERALQSGAGPQTVRPRITLKALNSFTNA